MAITQAVCNSFKTQLLKGVHHFTVLTGTNTISSVAAAGGTAGPNGTATTVYTGTFTNAASNAYIGLVLCFSGFTATNNNGTYLVVASTSTTLTVANPNGTNSVAGTPVVNATTDVFAIALFTSAATMNNATTAYASGSEVASSGSYVTGGIGPGGNLVGNAMALVSATPVLSTNKAICDFADIAWTSATITARGALVYNASIGTAKTDMPSVIVLDFTTDQSSSAGTFTIVFPAAAAGTAIIGLA